MASVTMAGAEHPGIAAEGPTFGVHEWTGSGPYYLHVHHEDDEAWHVLEGSLTFRLADRTLEAPAGTTVFVPAGVAHTYTVADERTRYLIVLTPRLRQLVEALQAAPEADPAPILRQYASEKLE